MKKITLFLLSIILFLSTKLVSQDLKKVSLADVWQYGAFREKTVDDINWLKSGEFYTALVDNEIIKYSVKNGEVIQTLLKKSQNKLKVQIEEYSFSEDEQKILIKANSEKIYRRSSIEENYIFDLKTNEIYPLSSSGKQMLATFSPDGKKIAFVRDNNIFLVDLLTKKETKITQSGKKNEIINGSTDWVYEEEFGFTRAFEWSPDSKKIAFISFDERKVPEYNMQYWAGLYPQDYRYKYPKAGENNSKVSLNCYDLIKNKTKPIKTGEDTYYIQGINWAQSSDILSFRKLNRHQDTLQIVHAQISNNFTNIAYFETNKRYIDSEKLADDLIYLKDGKSFLISSEKDGFNHIYHYQNDGKLIRQITTGNWDVDDFYGIDEENGLLYFTSTEVSSIERHLYVIKLDGTGKVKVSSEEGMNSLNFSKDFSYYILTNASSKRPSKVSLYKTLGNSLVKVLEDNQALANKLTKFSISYPVFSTIKLPNNTELNTWMLKPTDFDPQKKYPLIMFLYGGPGHQEVLDEWDGWNLMYYQTLLDKGYIVACVDNRGTGGKGEEFKKCTYKNLGKLELEDQIYAAKYFGSQS
ncbi:MAG: S9 family peptidase, partial [Pseudarcicella sp.]|nr:S9 family peptidase [Pseudarcicella sp.]